MLLLFLKSLGLILAVLLATVGYLVAPIVFQSLDQVSAGDLVGTLLTVSNWIVLTGLVSLLVIRWLAIKSLIYSWMLLISIGIVIFNQYWLSPLMQSIKLDYPHGLTQSSEAWPEFAMWHGVYQLLFLLLILLLFIWSVVNLKLLIYSEKNGNKKSL
ncbi:MAG: DUF4149 domain-containing protein [Pseudomonadota bacterium]|nr:DUF4149 domain-containing protein [Pseudomonadota bacterium]